MGGWLGDDNGRVSPRARWWSKTRGLPRDVYETWRSTLAGSGREARILAWAPTTSNGFCIGSPSALSHGTAERFEHVGWHQIEHGGWNAETRQLSWTVYYDEAASRRGAVELIESGRLPELFRERVAATIVLEQFVPFGADQRSRGVIISARRDLAGRADAIAWHATLSRGLAWQTEGVRALADRALDQLQTEYDTR